MPKPLRFALLGHPVAHSISPDLHRAAFAELGLPHTYEALSVPSKEAFAHALQELRAGRLAGANITLPHKQKAFEAADRRSDSALAAGAANVLMPEAHAISGEPSLTAHNTDLPALQEELSLLMHIEARPPQKALILGAGGAARAVIAAIRSIGITSICITTRSWENQSAAGASSISKELVNQGVQCFPYPLSRESRVQFNKFVEQSGLIVQASSAGMTGGDSGETIAALIPWRSLNPRTLAYDLVYTPPETPFVREAQKAGLRAAGGLGMLVRQAALSLQIWLGQKPSLEGLRHAAKQALSRRFTDG